MNPLNLEQQDKLIQQDRAIKEKEALQSWKDEKKHLKGIEQEERQKELRANQLKELREKEFPVDNEPYFAKKVVKEPKFKEEHPITTERFFSESDFQTEVTPFIQTQLKGTSYLKDTLRIPEDTTDSLYINEFIVEKMMAGKMKDTKENYDYILDRLMNKASVNRRQTPDYILKRIGIYLRNGGQEDDSLILSIMGRKINARIRRQ